MNKLMVDVGVNRNGAFIAGRVSADDAPMFLVELLDLFRDASQYYPELMHELQPLTSTITLDTDEDDWAERGSNGRRHMAFTSRYIADVPSPEIKEDGNVN